MNNYTITLGEIVENDIEIFDFDYPFYNEERRKQFEQHFIEHFYFDEIGQETVARFKQRLKIKLNLIMPYWNKIFLADELEQRILDNYDVTETFTREVENSTSTTSNNTNNNTETFTREVENSASTTSNNTNKNLASDTPVTRTDLNSNNDYYSSIIKDIGEGTSQAEGESIENWTRRMTGNIGVQTDADAIIKYWQSLRQIELEIFKQCDDLFMGVY